MTVCTIRAERAVAMRFAAQSDGCMSITLQTIAKLASSFWDQNLELAANLARQRADTWVGVGLLLLATVLGTGNLLWPLRYEDFDVNRCGAVLALILSVALGVAGLVLSRRIARLTAEKVRKTFEQAAKAK